MKGRFGLTSIPGTRLLIILTATLFAVGMAFLGLAAALGQPQIDPKTLLNRTKIEVKTIWTGSPEFGGLARTDADAPIWRPTVVDHRSHGVVWVDGYRLGATATEGPGWLPPAVVTWQTLRDAGYEGDYDATLSSAVSLRLLPDCLEEQKDDEGDCVATVNATARAYELIITIITDVEGETVEFVNDYVDAEAEDRSKTKGVLVEDDRRTVDSDGNDIAYLLLGETAVERQEFDAELLRSYKEEWAAELVAAAIRLEEAIPALWVELHPERTERYIRWGKVWLGTGLHIIQRFSGKEANTEILSAHLTPELIDLYMGDLAEVTADPERYFWGLSSGWDASFGNGDDKIATPCKEQRYQHNSDNKLILDADGFPIPTVGDPLVSFDCWKFNERKIIALQWPSPGVEEVLVESTGIGLPSGSLSR